MTIDAAILRLQVLAKSSSDVDIKTAPDYPKDSVPPLPSSYAYLGSGEATPQNGTSLRFNPVVSVDFLFTLENLPLAYKQINLLAREYPRRLAGDPTLGGSVETIAFPVTWEVSSEEFNMTPVKVLRFSVPLKTLETPITTA